MQEIVNFLALGITTTAVIVAYIITRKRDKHYRQTEEFFSKQNREIFSNIDSLKSDFSMRLNRIELIVVEIKELLNRHNAVIQQPKAEPMPILYTQEKEKIWDKYFV